LKFFEHPRRSDQARPSLVRLAARVVVLFILSGCALSACSSGRRGWLLSERAQGAGGAGALPEAGAAGVESGLPDAGLGESGAAGAAGAVSDAGAVGNAGAAGGGSSAGPRCPARFETACAPTVLVDNKDATSSGKLFSDALADPANTFDCITRDVCSLLFRKQTEIRPITQVTLIIEAFQGISETWSLGTESTIRVSSSHLQVVADAHGNVQDEIKGLLYYHATNIYQSDDGNGVANRWLVQGVANYVRHAAGYIPGTQQHPGGKYNDGGNTTGFFLVWLDHAYPDFVYELNQSLSSSDPSVWSPQAFEDITGHSVDQLWASYQATF